MDFYKSSPDEVLKAFDSRPDGLSDAQAVMLVQRHGLNRLQGKPPRPAWLIFLSQFRDVMIIILIAAAVISGLLGDVTDTLIILVIVLLNSILGFYQEYNASRAMEALKRMTSLQAQVVREGRVLRIPAEEIVPGDIVLLEAGNSVPADLRLMEAYALRIDESALTGESVPVDKQCEQIALEDVPLGDRKNMAYKGTLVTNGRASAVVVALSLIHI